MKILNDEKLSSIVGGCSVEILPAGQRDPVHIIGGAPEQLISLAQDGTGPFALGSDCGF